ncbi:MAG: SDR family NAD(P)-dependent oxidoreductase [Chloroflexi bacterium]|nr:SDR family NAD(P)-dependent oxidoreductase [Chloroflexota bacterium]
MKVLVTGGAGFIGRWVVRKLISDGVDVWVLDDLSNGKESNVQEFLSAGNYHGLTVGDVSDVACVERMFDNGLDVCVHAAAQINVQESLDHPDKSFRVNVVGTHNILRVSLRSRTRVVVVGTCMVYDTALKGGIAEDAPVKPSSPYAGAKLAAENMALSYHHGLGLPVVILRPFNTYGPFQKSNMEGGVVSIFVRNKLAGEKLRVFGDGTQTRDLLYVEDCADFIVNAASSTMAVGEIINGGTGVDVTINDLARMICGDSKRIEHVPHHHPQSEIPRLLCDNAKAKRLLNWQPRTSLEEGLRKTEQWIMDRETD